MIDTKAIREKVLDLALRGKLTEQRPEDGTAEELLIASKSMSSVSVEEEVFFEIPHNWKWCHLSDITVFNLGKTPARANMEYWEHGTYPWFSISDMTSKTLLDSREHITEKATHDCFAARPVPKGTLLMSFKLSIGKVAILGEDAYHNEAIISIYPKHDQDNILRDYLMLVLPFSSNHGNIHGAIKGNTLNRASLSSLLIPLPPLPEQHRIVAKIDAIFSLLDTIETLQSAYTANQKALRTKLIDAAIRGQLTEQLPEDGTAEELYQQIQQEKLALEKAGKIKKSKPLPPITDEEKPFDIPENWKWVSVGDVCTNIQYGTSKKSSETGKMPVIRMGNLQGGTIIYDKLAYTSDDNEIAKYPLEINDLLFNRTNSMELVGKTAIYKGEMPAIYAGYLVRITPLLLVSDYLNYVMQTKYYWDYCRIVRIDANGQSNINAEKLKRFVFPLPPLTEQKRIVAKLEELLPLCEG